MSEGSLAALKGMGTDKKIAVTMALTPDPELLPVVRILVGRLAVQMTFPEAQRFNLQQGVAQACGRAMEHAAGRDGRPMQLAFSCFADRLEVAVEDAGALSEADVFLLNQFFDRVAFEESAAGGRLTLVQYLSSVGSEP